MNLQQPRSRTTAIERSFPISGPSSASNTPTSGTFTDDFQKEKHRLSGKPLFRPVRRLSAASPSSRRRWIPTEAAANSFNAGCHLGAGSRRSSIGARTHRRPLAGRQTRLAALILSFRGAGSWGDSDSDRPSRLIFRTGLDAPRNVQPSSSPMMTRTIRVRPPGNRDHQEHRRSQAGLPCHCASETGNETRNRPYSALCRQVQLGPRSEAGQSHPIPGENARRPAETHRRSIR